MPYEPGTDLEIPGIEAKLEVGDASKIRFDHIPEATIVNDRSALDRIHVTQIDGLHDDPDARDSRTLNAGRNGENTGNLLLSGRTIGLTGYVRSNGVSKMRDLWRRFRSTFSSKEQDLLIHPPGEMPLYVNEIRNPDLKNLSSGSSGFIGVSTDGSGAALANYVEGMLSGKSYVVTGMTATASNVVIRLDEEFALNDGRDIWAHGFIRYTGSSATSLDILVRGYRYDPDDGTYTYLGEVLAGTTAAPASGVYHAVSGRVFYENLPALTTHVGISARVVKPASAGNWTLRATRMALVLVDRDDPAPLGFFDAKTPGFEAEEVVGESRSYGPCYQVNQVLDTESVVGNGWHDTSDAGATIVGPGITQRWPAGRSAIYYKATNPDATVRDLSVSSAIGSVGDYFVVAGGRNYRISAHVNLVALFSLGTNNLIFEVAWIDYTGSVVATDVVETITALGDDEHERVIAAPEAALLAYVTFRSSSSASATNNTMELMFERVRFMDVSEYDPGEQLVDTSLPPEIAVGQSVITRLGPKFKLSPAGTRRRVPRPFLVRKIRSMWDGKAPESQRSLRATRDFTLSMRAADPRVYVLDERHASLRAQIPSTLSTYPFSTYAAGLANPINVADDYDLLYESPGGGALNGYVAVNGTTWATQGPNGDFTFQSESGVRAAGAVDNDRWAVFGANSYDTVEVIVKIKREFLGSTLGDSGKSFAFARWTDSSNYVRAEFTTYPRVRIVKVVAGVETILVNAAIPTGADVSWKNKWMNMKFLVYKSGKIALSFLDDVGNQVAHTATKNTDLAAGGALATGKVGFGEINVSNTGSLYGQFFNFFVYVPAADPGGPPGDVFTDEGTLLTTTVGWRSATLGGTAFPGGGTALGVDLENPPSNGYIPFTSTARGYYTGPVYTQPVVTVSGSPISNADIYSQIFDLDVAYVGGSLQYNYVGALLKRASSTTWLEARFTTSNNALFSPTHSDAPFSIELWSSHNSSGGLVDTRLVGWDVPTSVVVDGVRKYLRAIMDATGVVYIELWSQPPNMIDAGLLFRDSYALTSSLSALVGPAVAGQAGYVIHLGRWSSGTLGANYYTMETSWGLPYIATFDVANAYTNFLAFNCPVIGDIEEVPLTLMLRGDLSDPKIGWTNLDSGDAAQINLSGVFPESDPVTIDLGAGTIKSASGADYFLRRMPGSRFFALQPGNNVIAVEATDWDIDAPAHVIASWRDALK